MSRLTELINKAATCGRFLTLQEEADLKQLHESKMKALAPPVEWDFVELKKMRA